jgi:transcription initiation factor IIE alpha subunit
MTITRKEFEAGNFKHRVNKRKNHPVVLLLSNHPNTAYTVKDMEKATGMKSETIRDMLSKIRKEGLIVHKIPYFAWKRSKR